LSGRQIKEDIAGLVRELRRRRPDLTEDGRRRAAVGAVEAAHLRDVDRGVGGSQAYRRRFARERVAALWPKAADSTANFVAA
jgi:hypothetical protein